MKPAIAIVGIACRYPDARSPVELWENVLAQRQAFRRIPPERLRLADYLSTDHAAPDHTYVTQAALIEDYEFDRVRFQVAGSTFRSVDLAHWLALDVAAQALTDAGFPQGDGLPRETTGVLVGNTLTGEFSRANVMRLRWPYVRRVVDAALIEQSWAPEQRRAFLQRLETQYKAPFQPVGEETLAGGLSNTIAGRICNYFDLKGGGYTVDGACASSLLAVATACSALMAGDLDVAIAGGVDLSLDPFELVGFARVGALAPEKMRIYDARSNGFWPGEGCGFVVLMRHDETVAQKRRIYAVIRGWGISSDGSGGLTRPEVEGQALAVRRAYLRAGFGAKTVAYFEGHGTGTSVGDATELRVLAEIRREALNQVSAAAIGSIKANIGHTKAAAGVAGLIKTTMAIHSQILPPTTGCDEPHPELTGEVSTLRVLPAPEPWPPDQPLRASVSAMGFGGINAHIALEGVAARRRDMLGAQERSLIRSTQDAELFLLSARSVADLQQQVEHLLAFAFRLSQAELIDLAARLEEMLELYPVRAAIVAASPAKLASGLQMLRGWLTEGSTLRLDVSSGVNLGIERSMPRLGFLFPGQGSPIYFGGGAMDRRFQCVAELYAQANLPQQVNPIDTAVAQPAIVTASMAALRVLDRFGLEASVAVGHSLGELTALHWAGAMDESALLSLAAFRGQAMGRLGSPSGAMASIEAGYTQVKELLNGEGVVVAGINSPRQTVISGEAAHVDAMVASARARGLNAVILPVSHAFHSPLVTAAAQWLAEYLAGQKFRPLQRSVVSTVTGALLAPTEELPRLLCNQVTEPVRFMEAVTAAAADVDLWIEGGPGRVLSSLVSGFLETPVIGLDAGGPSLQGLLQAVGAAFVLGTPINHRALFSDRFTRPFNLNWQPRFFVNPCELAPLPETFSEPEEVYLAPTLVNSAAGERPIHVAPEGDVLGLVRQLVAERTELPAPVIRDDHRLLSDLHLNSITVSQLVVEAAQRLNLPPPIVPTNYADVTVADMAGALEELVRTGSARSIDEEKRLPPGVDVWIRTFTVDLVERPISRRRPSTGTGTWQVIAPPDYPLAERLQQAFDRLADGRGIVVCLPPGPDENHLSLLLEGVRMTLKESQPTRFVLVQHNGLAAVFARTLHLEAPITVTTCVVDVPSDHPLAVKWVVAEAMAAAQHSEAYYDAGGRRREPVLRLLTTENKVEELPLGPADVILVTGGKGITAECALALARQTGARLALLGRSQQAEDVELAANLERMATANIHFRYITVDVTKQEAVQAAIREIEANLGAVTAVIHGAARNVPALLASLDEAKIRETLAPKVQGMQNILAAVNPNQLRLLVAFGSIIARTGLPGEADYGLANAWLTRLTERFQAEHPTCRCLAVEWSIWSELGMGARLGRVDRLAQQGITPIPPGEGVAIFLRLLSQRLPVVAVTVTGRFGELPTLKVEQPELPFWRFLERPRVYFPQVELIVEAELSADTDPYLNDHVLRGERLFPAVMGLEAMAQTAMALVEATEPPIFEQVEFKRAVVIPAGPPVTVRIGALVRQPGQVEVVLRSQDTAFQVDHFRAICRFGRQEAADNRQSFPAQMLQSSAAQFPLMDLDPERDLYGGLLFHQGRFRRLRGYRQLAARACIAEIVPDGETAWLSRYLSPHLALGDPGGRDAALHAIQACVPQATLLPVGVERLILSSAGSAEGPRFVQARERQREGDIFTYDVEVTDSAGRVQERWESLRLQIVAGAPLNEPWAGPLLGPYLERRLQELIPGAAAAVTVEHDPGGTERRARSDQAIQRMLGKMVPIRRRPDGKPYVVDDNCDVSVAHAGHLTLAVAGPAPIACDLERVEGRSAGIWRELLGEERFMLAGVIARQAHEDTALAATRVWTASECLKKAGVMVSAPLVFTTSTPDGWVGLVSGKLNIVTLVTSVRSEEKRLVFAVLTGVGNIE